MTDSRQRVVARGWEQAEEVAAEPLRGVRPVALARPDDPGLWLGRLVRTIEAEVIPRLVLSGRAAALAQAQARAPLIEASQADIIRLADLVLARSDLEVDQFVDGVRQRGMAIENLYLDLLTPVARRLGDLWKEDLCDFAQVTLALGRLHDLLRALSPAFQDEVARKTHGLRALLVPVPGEQHSFGLVMVAEFFRRAGWDVWSGPIKSTAELAGIARTKWFSVIGLSVSCAPSFDHLAQSIRAVRRTSRNRGVGVLVGGPIFIDHPELVAKVGADATASDGRQAVIQAHNLLDLLAKHR